MVSSVSDASAQRNARGKPAKKQAVPSEADAAQSVARPERGHIFNLKPISQQGTPLRLSKLPG